MTTVDRVRKLLSLGVEPPKIAPPAVHIGRHLTLDKGNTLEQQERADLAAAQRHFALLGWPAGSLEVAPGDAAGGCDGELGALLRRAAALQQAREQGGAPPDWEQPEWRWGGDGDGAGRCGLNQGAAGLTAGELAGMGEGLRA